MYTYVSIYICLHEQESCIWWISLYFNLKYIEIWNINLKYFKFNLKYTIENEESYKVVITLNIMRVHTHTE